MSLVLDKRSDVACIFFIIPTPRPGAPSSYSQHVWICIYSVFLPHLTIFLQNGDYDNTSILFCHSTPCIYQILCVIRSKNIVKMHCWFFKEWHSFNFDIKYHVKQNNMNCLWPGLPWWLSGKESVCNTKDSGSRFDPWVRKSPQSGEMVTHSNILSLENSMDRGATVHGVEKS